MGLAPEIETDRPSYTGREPGVPERQARQADGDSYFQVTPKPLPAGSVPITDDDHQTVIGYRGPYHGGMARVYDVAGREVSLIERPLETPLLDPIDLIIIVGSFGRVLVRGLFRAGVEIGGETAAKVAAREALGGFVPMLRLAFRMLVQRELKFTATTLARLADGGRYVPINILKLAVRYGARDADPQGVAGAFRYSIAMVKGAKTFGKPAREYMLRVIVREADWTVLHFHYE